MTTPENIVAGRFPEQTLEGALTDEQVAIYLKALGIEEPVSELPVNRETLDRLTFAHQCRIPFSNLDVNSRNPIPSQDIDELFEKAIVQGRGGYCFELNPLFEALLAAVGFKVRTAMCRVVRGRDTRLPINHRGILVYLDDQLMFTDVGFGGPMPASSLVLEDGLEQISMEDTFCTRDTGTGWYAIERVTRSGSDFFDDGIGKRWQVELEVCSVPFEHIDFAALNAWLARPGAVHYETSLANLRTPIGHYALNNDKLTIRENGVKTVIELEPESRDDIIEQYFGFRP